MLRHRVDQDATLVTQALNLRTLVDHLGACFYAKSLDGRYLFANQATCDFLQTSAAALVGRSDHDFMDLHKSQSTIVNDRRVFAEGREIHDEEHVFLLDGSSRVFWSNKVPIRDAQGHVIGLCGISTDITQRRRAFDELSAQNVLFDTVLSNIGASVFVKDAGGRYLYVNQSVVDLLGRPEHEVIGSTDAELLTPEVAESLMAVDRQVLQSGQRLSREEMVIDADGCERYFWTIKFPLQLSGGNAGLIGLSTEITELMALRQRVEQQRVTDPLTGLGNRVQFEEDLLQGLRVAQRHQASVAVALIDIDNFKYINNSLGQEVGDRLIREVAARLSSHGDAFGALARLSGDEFALMLPRQTSAAEVARLVEEVRASLAQPYRLDDRVFHLTASAGISVYPDDGADGAILLAHAEAAMYHAKDRGRDQCRFYSRAMGLAVAERLELERDLRDALAGNEFELHYQPKIARIDGRVAGFEALLRWNRRGHGRVLPNLFIPLAEQLGLLTQIGHWLIEEACRQAAQWRMLGLGEVPVAVNLSPSQLASPVLIGQVAQIMARHGIGESGLEMEVTESMMMDDPEQAIAILHGLRREGVKLSIDDFGTGYSSMAYLKRLPVDTLKLDRQFVTHVASDPRDADICAGMIALAHKLGLKVVAEGVETEDQRDALAARDCDLYQGYLFSRPLSAEQATAFLSARLH